MKNLNELEVGDVLYSRNDEDSFPFIKVLLILSEGIYLFTDTYDSDDGRANYSKQTGDIMNVFELEKNKYNLYNETTTDVMEVTMDEIAKKFDISVDDLKIIKD